MSTILFVVLTILYVIICGAFAALLAMGFVVDEENGLVNLDKSVLEGNETDSEKFAFFFGICTGISITALAWPAFAIGWLFEKIRCKV